MKLWLRLTLVCCVLLCLFLSLPQAVGLNHRLHIVGLRPWFDRGREPASDAPKVSVVRRMRFDQPRARPLAYLVLDCAWTASNLGPPGPRPMGHRNRSGLRELPVKRSSRQLQPTPSSTLFSTKLLPQTTNFEESGFHKQPLANQSSRLQGLSKSHSWLEVNSGNKPENGRLPRTATVLGRRQCLRDDGCLVGSE
jgi:hypothetical protein